MLSLAEFKAAQLDNKPHTAHVDAAVHLRTLKPPAVATVRYQCPVAHVVEKALQLVDQERQRQNGHCDADGIAKVTGVEAPETCGVTDQSQPKAGVRDTDVRKHKGNGDAPGTEASKCESLVPSSVGACLSDCCNDEPTR